MSPHWYFRRRKSRIRHAASHALNPPAIIAFMKDASALLPEPKAH